MIYPKEYLQKVKFQKYKKKKKVKIKIKMCLEQNFVAIFLNFIIDVKVNLENCVGA